MKRHSQTYFDILWLAFLSVMLTSCLNDNDNKDGGLDQTSIVKVGDDMPAFTLTAQSGEVISSSSLSGQIYLLNFFDTRCKDCQQEFPILQQIYEKYRGMVTVFNVPRSQTPQEVEAYWKENGLSMPYYIANDNQLYYKFATRGIPRNYIVDRKGQVQAIYTDSPVADFSTLDNTLQNLLHDAIAKDEVEMTLNIKVPFTRSTSEEYHFQNEYVISKLELFFFNVQTRKLLQRVVVRDLVKTENEANQKYDITYIINTLRVKVGEFNIFAIANYNYTPDDINDQDTFLNMIDSITYKDGISAGIADTGPVMTNRATSQLNVNLVPYSGKTFILTFEMERIMAKLRLGIKQNTFELKNNDKKYAEIHITNYKFVNLNNKYYLFQHKDNVPTLGSKPYFRISEHFGEYSGGNDEYIVDPHFYEKTNSEDAVNKFGDYYTSWYGSFTTKDFASMPAAGSYAYAYILENTTYKLCQKNGYSTGIVFKAAVSPVSVFIYDNKEKKLQEETRPEYWPKVIYLYNYQFYSSIQAVNIASGLKLDELQEYNDSQLKEHGIKQCKFNMGVYETYYTYWIQHRTDLVENMGSMKFGIVRNNYYNMIVTGITGIGNSVITPETLRDNYPNSYLDVTANKED